MDEQVIRSEESAAEHTTSRHVTIVKARNKRIALIVVSLCICLILVASVATTVFLFLQAPKDDGLILNNVVVGGVNIGGMTRADAENVIRLTIESVITSQDMVVRLDYDALTISPQDVDMRIDVTGLVDAAYSYGRTGSNAQQNWKRIQAETKEYHIALLPYLKLNLNAVYEQVKTFCAGYRINLTQPSVSLIGDRPTYGDVVTAHQKLVITMGTPQSNLTADDLYTEILDGYSLCNLELYYEPPVIVEPEKPDAQAIFDEYCIAPQDATIDSKTFAVTPEVYGYGFNIATIQRRIDRADPGDQIEITLEFMMPDITAEALSGDLFKDTLATYTSVCTDSYNANRNKNLRLACETIDGYVIKVGERFDFNAIFGRLTTVQGYASAPTYSGSNTSTVGGGIGQVASVLHYCAMLSELEINERSTHRFAVAYTPLGTDAAISYGAENLVFTNNTSAPIRILASVTGSTVTITFLGTSSQRYTTAIEQEALHVYEPHTTYQFMTPENVYNYKDGHVLQSGIIGYELQMYLCKYDAVTGQLIAKEPLEILTYDSRDETIVRIGTTEDDGTGTI